MTRRLALVAALGAGVALTPALALAIPPTGPAEDPGDPPASVAIATSAVAPHGVVAFTGEGFTTTAGKPQVVYVKVDDAGQYGIGPFKADAAGKLAGSVSLDDREAPAAANAEGEHALRFLAGPSGENPQNGPARSIRAPFTVSAAAAAPVATDTAPTTAAPVTFALAGTSLAGHRDGTVTVSLRTSAPGGIRGAITLTARDPLKLGKAKARPALKLAAGRFALADDAPATLELELTKAGRQAIAARKPARIPLRVSITSAAGPALATTATLRRAT